MRGDVAALPPLTAVRFGTLAAGPGTDRAGKRVPSVSTDMGKFNGKLDSHPRRQLAGSTVFRETTWRRKMSSASDLLPGRMLRKARVPHRMPGFRGVQIDDPKLSELLSANTELLILHQG